MKTVFTFVALLFGINGFCQAPGIEWQNTIGGSNLDQLRTIKITSDGNYIIGGRSFSGISGDKTEAVVGSEDFWILKLDVLGNIIWQNTIGGITSDVLNTINQTNDGGYIIGGNSSSGISGDKSEASLGMDDYWVVKLDSLGIIQWQNTIGGSGDEYLKVVIQTNDNGYILGGDTDSPISGDKTDINFGLEDYWVIKLDSMGAIEWQKTFGGDKQDWLNDIIETEDGGVLIGGNSNSGISGNKSEPNYGIGSDYWIIKLDPTGNLEWQKAIGGDRGEGLSAIYKTNDSAYIIGGHSYSGISGVKTEINIGFNDFWITKINLSGEIIWQKTIGGTSSDYLMGISPTMHNGIIACGYSNSDISGDKSEDSRGIWDIWIVKLDSLGQLVWENTISGNDDEAAYEIIQTSDAGYIIGGYSDSDIAYDKTEGTVGGSIYDDYWVLKLLPDCIGITETIAISAGGPTTFCQGGNVLLTATYSGATVQWKKNGTNIPGATSPTYLVTTKGTYTCETTSVCDTELSTGIFVNVQKNPPAAITAGGPTTFCAGGSVILTANAGGGLSYQWYKGASLIAGATSINYTATIAGNYKCRVTKTATGCFKNSNVINVSVPCKEGVLTTNEKTITIAPNPNNGTFMLDVLFIEPKELNPETATVEIYNPLSQLIFTQQLPVLDNAIHENISINNLAAGIYQVKIIFAENSYTQQLLIHN
ncbi:MAG: T9SS type A sorting domain-containing protein [Bacteroidetes bacterium]|jgi:hypothetical protein|nr:T9SS type A sorting domain-containing protein [Bacteroidota bacterium]